MSNLVKNFNNQKHKLIIFVLLIVTLLLFIIGLIYKLLQNNEVINLNPIDNQNNSNIYTEQIIIDNEDKENKDKKEIKSESYNINYEFPKNEERVKNEIENISNNWLKENIEYCKKIQKETREVRCEFSSKYKKYASNETISFVNEIYTFSGGAHGSVNYITTTYDKNGKIIKPEEILSDKNLEQVSKIAFNEIQKIRRDRIVNSDINEKDKQEILKSFSQDISWVKEGTSPKRENYNIVWLDGNDIVIYFGQYQVAAYAEGDFIIRIPKSILEK